MGDTPRALIHGHWETVPNEKIPVMLRRNIFITLKTLQQLQERERVQDTCFSITSEWQSDKQIRLRQKQSSHIRM